MDQNQAELEQLIQRMLQLIGEDDQREGLAKTPGRVAHAMRQLTRGYELDPAEVLNSAKFREDYRQMVVVKDIEFHSLCEHHILPFFGKVHIGYIPDGQIVGLSKLPRVVDIFSHRLQVQERFTTQIRRCIEETLQPRGVIVVVEAQHLCMQMRGVTKQGAVTQTIDYCGDFAQADKRQEFFNLIRG